MSSVSLSVLVHTKNEAANIEECLRSCQSIADELVVADMQSRDETVVLARKMGATILPVVDYGYVEPARQTALNSLNGEWILILDADERLTPTLRKKIREHVRKSSADILRLPRKNIFLGQWMQHGLLWPDYQVRLFRKGSVQWSNVIHAQPKLFGSHKDLPAREENALVHLHRATVPEFVEKMLQQALHETYYSDLESITPSEVIHRITGEFMKRYFQNEGYKDGVRGLIFARTMGYYQFLSFAHQLEKSGYPEVFSRKDLALWNNEIELYLAREELKRIYDSKFYRVFRAYEFLKKVIFLQKKT